MTQFLASVTTVDEALLATRCGADIIDCKDPSRGALGALSIATVAAIKAALPRSATVSATIGDLPCDPVTVPAAARAMAASGCDIVKIGIFPGGDPRAAIAALGGLNLPSVRLVGLLLADCEPDFALIAAMGEAGFSGVMLDTAIKGTGTLRDHMTSSALAQFVSDAHAHGLFAGFAGSLGLSDIAPLMRLKPNVLGFRGALCDRAIRTGCLSGEAIRAVAAEMERHASHGSESPQPIGAIK